MAKVTVRHLDELGRIVIPQAIRTNLAWKNRTQIDVCEQDGKVILSTHSKSCLFCGGTEGLCQFAGKDICQDCLNELKKIES